MVEFLGVEEVGSTSYLDMGEINFPESRVSDGWQCDFFLESGEAGVSDSGYLTASQNLAFQMASHN